MFMNKLDNYIFYTICEKFYELYKDSNFITFRRFCENFTVSFKLNNFNNKELRMISEIVNHLKLIYNLELDEGIDYISFFLTNEKWVIFDETVIYMNKYFKNSFN